MRWRVAAFVVTGALAVALAAASTYAWTRDSTADGKPSSSAVSQVERGRMLFESKGCVACHHIALKGLVDGFGQGPDLSNLPTQAGTQVEGLSADEYVRVSILNPDAFYAAGYSYSGAFGMPQIEVTGDEVDALVAFLLAES